MSTYAIALIVDVPDVEKFAAWFYGVQDGIVSNTAGVVTVKAYLEDASTALVAGQRLVQHLREHHVEVLGVDLDLVNTSDIAERIDRSRQYVRQLIEGKAGPGGFPRPVGWPGGVRAWDWGSVNEWLRALGHGDEEVHLNRELGQRLDAWIQTTKGAVSLSPKQILSLRGIKHATTGSYIVHRGRFHIEDATTGLVWGDLTKATGTSIADEALEYLEQQR